MNSKGRPFKIILLLAAFWLLLAEAYSATYYSRQTGNWNSRVTWSTSGHGGSAASGTPGPGDVVYIGNHTITVTANAACSDLRFSGGFTSGTINVNTGYTLTVSRAVTVISSDNSNTSSVFSGGGQLICASLAVGTNANPNPSRTTSLFSDIAALSVTGNVIIYSSYYSYWFWTYSNNASFTINAGMVTVGGSVETDNENNSNTSTLTLGNGAPWLSEVPHPLTSTVPGQVPLPSMVRELRLTTTVTEHRVCSIPDIPILPFPAVVPKPSLPVSPSRGCFLWRERPPSQALLPRTVRLQPYGTGDQHPRILAQSLSRYSAETEGSSLTTRRVSPSHPP